MEPNFMVIGAQKAGTTWLHHILDGHPEVFVPREKESHFFNYEVNFSKGRAFYESLFDRAADRLAVGECTPNYLWVNNGRPSDHRRWEEVVGHPVEFEPHPELSTHIAAQVADWYPDLKLVVSLRNPVDRAVSSYLHQIRRRRVSPRDSILEIGGSFGIIGMGFYESHLSEWLAHFDRDQILVLIQEEDMGNDRAAITVDRVYGHLGVEVGVRPTAITQRFNTRSGNLMLRLQYYTPVLAKAAARFPSLSKVNYPKDLVSIEEKAGLADIYAADVSRLEKLLGRDFAIWRR